MSLITVEISFRVSNQRVLVTELTDLRGVETFMHVMLVHTVEFMGIGLFSWERVVLSRLTDLGAKL